MGHRKPVLFRYQTNQINLGFKNVKFAAYGNFLSYIALAQSGLTLQEKYNDTHHYYILFTPARYHIWFPDEGMANA